MDKYKLRDGDVVSYTPTDRWCHEGTAIAVQRGNRMLLLDTYWGSHDPAVLTESETASAALMFNLADYDELDRYLHSSPVTWEKYAPADRQLITMQHGLQRRWFTRKGAAPDWRTQIDNAHKAFRKRTDALDSARRQVEWARQDLADVVTKAQAAGAAPKHPNIGQPCNGWLCDGSTDVCDDCGTEIAAGQC